MPASSRVFALLLNGRLDKIRSHGGLERNSSAPGGPDDVENSWATVNNLVQRSGIICITGPIFHSSLIAEEYKGYTEADPHNAQQWIFILSRSMLRMGTERADQHSGDDVVLLIRGCISPRPNRNGKTQSRLDYVSRIKEVGKWVKRYWTLPSREILTA